MVQQINSLSINGVPYEIQDAALAVEVTNLAENVSNISTDLGSLSTNVDSLSQTAADLNEDVVKISNKTDKLSNEIATINDNLNSQASSIVDLTYSVTELESSKVDLSAEVAKINANVTSLTDTMETCYKAKVEDSELFLDPVITKIYYAIKNKLTRVATSNPAETIEAGTAYSATLSYDNMQYSSFSELSVSVNGRDVTLEAIKGDPYADSEVTVEIPADKVVGDIVIVARAGGYLVTYDLDGVTFDDETPEITDIAEGDPLYVKLVSTTGENISWEITMGDEAISTEYVMDDGLAILINIPTVTGNITVKASA